MSERKIVLEAAQKLYRLKLVAGTSGNISMRSLSQPDSRFFITASGMAYDTMGEEDIVEIDQAGAPLNPAQRPSSEWRMHLEIYRKYPQVNAIVHTHSPFATGFAVCQEKIPLILIEMKPFLGGDVPVAPFAPAGSQKLADGLIPYLKDRNACLLANHGVVCCGKNMDDAFIVGEYVEDAAKIYYYAKTAGTPVILE